MKKFSNILNRIQRVMTVTGAICLSGMALLTCCDVVGRFFNHPIFGAEEIVTILAALVVALSLPYAHSEKSHIGVEMLVRLLNKETQRKIKIVTEIAAFMLFSIVSWRMVIYARTMQASGEVSMNLELPEYYVIYAISFSFIIFSLLILKDIISLFQKGRE